MLPDLIFYYYYFLITGQEPDSFVMNAGNLFKKFKTLCGLNKTYIGRVASD